MFKVVIVDDEYLIRMSIGKIVRELGLNVTGEAKNGEEALDVVGLYEPDIVFTDIKMPKKNGLQLAAELRQRRPDIFVVIVTGYEDFGYLREALQYGVEDYILKPIDAAQIRTVVAHIMDKIRARPGEHATIAQKMNRAGEFAVRTVEALWTHNGESVESLLADMRDYFQSEGVNESSGKPYAYYYLEQVTAAIAERMDIPDGYADRLPNLYWNDTIPFVESFIRDLQRDIVTKKHWSDSYKIRAALAYIENHYTRPELALKDVAAHVGMLASSFSQAFKQEMNQGYIRYVIQLRMRQAERLLSQTTMNAYEIAKEVGYDNYAHFNKAFKKYSGSSPKQFRDRHYGEASHGGHST